MAVDRDLAVAILTAWGSERADPAEGWDALAATGVRGLRLLHETGALRRVVLSETSPLALLVLQRNARREDPERATAVEHDARFPLEAGGFDFVDVDPFGTPTPYLDAAFESLRLNGLLGVAATDMPVLAGVERGAAERRYGARPVRGRLGPEGGLRILLAYLARVAATHLRRVQPLVAYVHDHHVRAYVRVTKSDGSSDPVNVVGDHDWNGPVLGGRGPYGPLWCGPLFDIGFVKRLRVPPTAQDPTSTARFVQRFQEEAESDAPFYYEPNELAGRLRLRSPPSPERLVEALRSEGWKAGRTHARPAAFRTTAPRIDVERLAVVLSTRGRGESQSQNARVRA